MGSEEGRRVAWSTLENQQKASVHLLSLLSLRVLACVLPGRGVLGGQWPHSAHFTYFAYFAYFRYLLWHVFCSAEGSEQAG